METYLYSMLNKIVF